ncbi:MAG TPA: CAP domain-containing protein [Roseiflexaceae bacterium]|nr:CAP domain-containing protein [Roseiflexaceae bacterium]
MSRFDRRLIVLFALVVGMLAPLSPAARAQDDAPPADVGATATFQTFLPIIVRTGVTIGSPTTDEQALARLINDYRQSRGLGRVPVSRSLTQVAQLHVKDLVENSPDSGSDNRGLACSLHSWSNKGNWTPVCYTSDHEYASGMWNKPREITNNVYNSNGYEISFWISTGATPAAALDAWKNSAAHNQVILQQNGWPSWRAMGVGMRDGYAVVWFGEITDPAGNVP